MINYDRHNRQMIVRCDDECGYEEEFSGKWQYCVDMARRSGWLISKRTNDRRLHICPKCVKLGNLWFSDLKWMGELKSKKLEVQYGGV